VVLVWSFAGGNDDNTNCRKYGNLFFHRLGASSESRGRLEMVAFAGVAEAHAKLGGGFAVTEEAKSAEVLEVALTSTFGYGADVVGVPQAATRSDGFHSVEMQACSARGAAGSFECVVGGDGVDAADSTGAVIAREDLVAEVAWVGAETPLVDAVVAAEGAATFGEDLEVAPAAEGQAVRAERESFACGAAAGKGTRGEHACLRIGRDCEVGDDEMGSLVFRAK
jgi:hypothetical protein